MFTETADIETSSADYATRFSGPTGEWLLSVQESALLHCLSPDLGKRVLDVGGGHGQIAKPLTKLGFEVTVLGSAEACIGPIQSEVSSGKIKFQVGDVLSLPYAKDSFDIVTSFRLLPHCKAWPQLIAELCRVAKQAVIIDYPTTQNINFLTPLLFNLKKKLEGNTRTYTLFSHMQIKQEFDKAEFEVEKRVGEFFFPMVLHRKLACPRVSSWSESLAGGLGLKNLLGSPVVAMARSRADFSVPSSMIYPKAF